MSVSRSLESARTQLIARIGDAAALIGVSRMAAQIYALLLVNEDALSLSEIAAALGVSKASVSTHARKLAAHGAIHRTWAPGTRADHYEAESDVLKVVRLWLRTGFVRRLELANDILAEADAFIDAAEAGRGAPLPRVRARVASMRQLQASLTALLRALPGLNGSDGEA